jgi:CxxC motif-containing protein
MDSNNFRWGINLNNITQKDKVLKTTRENHLKAHYMAYIESDDKIDKVIIKEFLKDVEMIKVENPIYWGIK